MSSEITYTNVEYKNGVEIHSITSKEHLTLSEWKNKFTELSKFEFDKQYEQVFKPINETYQKHKANKKT